MTEGSREARELLAAELRRIGHLGTANAIIDGAVTPYEQATLSAIDKALASRASPDTSDDDKELIEELGTLLHDEWLGSDALGAIETAIHRISSLATIRAGVVEERAAIVAWLESDAPDVAYISRVQAAAIIAAIQAGDHLSKSEGGR